MCCYIIEVQPFAKVEPLVYKVGMIDFFVENGAYFLIPVIAAIVGWVTNWVAIQMTFYPLEPIGRPPYFGWVGIIPAKAEKMGRIATRSVLAKLGTLREVFEAMEPEKIANHVIHELEPQIETYVDGVMLEDNPTVWELTPNPIKQAIYFQARRKLPAVVNKITAEVRDHIEDMIDLEWTVIDKLRRDKALTNRIFLECGAEEFQFIIRSGLYFGFGLGVLQALIWAWVQWQFAPVNGVAAWWLLPIFGVIVGYATNALALRIIFRPIHPIQIGRFTIQGLFLKRQNEVADVWTEIVTSEILTVRNIIDSMLHGPKAIRTQTIIRHHVRKMADEILGPTKIIAQGALGIRGFSELKDVSADVAIELGMTAFADPVFIAGRAKVVKALMFERMQALTPEEFQVLLRPAFQEDETKLIALGAVLGGVAGVLQLLTLF